MTTRSSVAQLTGRRIELRAPLPSLRVFMTPYPLPHAATGSPAPTFYEVAPARAQQRANVRDRCLDASGSVRSAQAPMRPAASAIAAAATNAAARETLNSCEMEATSHNLDEFRVAGPVP